LAQHIFMITRYITNLYKSLLWIMIEVARYTTVWYNYFTQGWSSLWLRAKCINKIMKNYHPENNLYISNLKSSQWLIGIQVKETNKYMMIFTWLGVRYDIFFSNPLSLSKEGLSRITLHALQLLRHEHHANNNFIHFPPDTSTSGISSACSMSSVMQKNVNLVWSNKSTLMWSWSCRHVNCS
jgi:hypothetical protein